MQKLIPALKVNWGQEGQWWITTGDSSTKIKRPDSADRVKIEDKSTAERKKTFQKDFLRFWSILSKIICSLVACHQLAPCPAGSGWIQF